MLKILKHKLVIIGLLIVVDIVGIGGVSIALGSYILIL